MTANLYASGTQTATIGTEHFLNSPSVSGTFTLHVDRSNMTSTDITELRVYQKVLTGGTARVAYFQRLTGAPATDDSIVISVPISNDLAEANAIRFSLTQTDGTGRAYAWKVLVYG